MGRENLSIIFNQDYSETSEMSKFDLGSYLPGYRLTGIWVRRPAMIFATEEDRLLKAFILPGVAVEVVSLDQDKIVRSQIFQCRGPETEAMVGYTSTSPSAEEKYFFIREALHLIDPKVS